jgi:muramoyltetrapeptide carboxypeptidase LdcA involved in peptidoglycan recycling
MNAFSNHSIAGVISTIGGDGSIRLEIEMAIAIRGATIADDQVLG